jgi:triacylglycerol esterase/lipase EstA (alpha/beta hydrolase family)
LVEQSNNKPLFLIHGLGRSRFDLIVLGASLKRFGFTPYYFAYSSQKHTINHHADILKEFVDSKLKKDKPLFFVGHSLGGIITLRCLEKLSFIPKGSRAVLLGTPINGSSLARFCAHFSFFRALFGPILIELSELYKSENDFNTFDLPDVTVALFTGGTGFNLGFNPFLPGDNDGIVTVKETFSPSFALHERVFALHPLLMFSPLLIKKTREFLLLNSAI